MSMFSHVMVGCDDIAAARRFYDTILGALGLTFREPAPDGGPRSLCWVDPSQSLPRFYVTQPFDRQGATVGNGSMIAFLAESCDLVDRIYHAGLAAGGADDGAPGPRTHYGEGYYGAYLRDPAGNKIHLVFRGDLDRAAGSSQ